jgi:copper resistance protein C
VTTSGRKAWKLLIATGALAAAAAVGTGLAIPAAADDSLLSTDPATGAVLDAPPDAMTLTYSSDVAAEFAQAVVTAPGAEAVPLPPASITASGPDLTLDLTDLAAGAPAGEWSIVVRIVSVDGHPVEEQVGFESGPGATQAPTAAPGPGGTPEAPPASAAGADPTATSTPEVSSPTAQSRANDDEGSTWTTPVVIALAAVLAAALTTGIVLVVRRR